MSGNLPNAFIITAGNNGTPFYLGRIAAHVIIAHPGTSIGGIWNLLFRDPFSSCTGGKVTDLADIHRVRSDTNKAWDGDTLELGLQFD